jgi:putative hemolysin
MLCEYGLIDKSRLSARGAVTLASPGAPRGHPAKGTEPGHQKETKPAEPPEVTNRMRRREHSGQTKRRTQQDWEPQTQVGALLQTQCLSAGGGRRQMPRHQGVYSVCPNPPKAWRTSSERRGRRRPKGACSRGAVGSQERMDRDCH